MAAQQQKEQLIERYAAAKYKYYLRVYLGEESYAKTGAEYAVMDLLNIYRRAAEAGGEDYALAVLEAETEDAEGNTPVTHN